MRAATGTAAALALALAACAQTPSNNAPSAAPVAAAPSAPVPGLSDEDRVAFFVNHARHGELEPVRQEIEAGIDVNRRDHLDQTALIAAVTQRSAPIVALLLAHGADPNLGDNAGWTPLIYGAYFGVEPEILQALIDRGAQINARNDRGITALYLASATGHEAQVRFLLDRGADRSLASSSGYTPQRIAQLRGLGKIVTMLDAGASAGGAAPAAASR